MLLVQLLPGASPVSVPLLNCREGHKMVVLCALQPSHREAPLMYLIMSQMG